MERFETEFLLPSSRRPKLITRCKPFLIALLILSFLLSLAAFGLVYKCELGGNCVKNVRNKMPPNFKAIFNTKGGSAYGLKADRTIEVTWDRKTHDLRYRETVFRYPKKHTNTTIRSTEKVKFMTLTIAKNLSLVTIDEVQNDEITCDVSKSSRWYSAFHSVLSSKLKKKTSASCPGILWIKGEVQVCVKESTILYMQYGQRKARLVSWSPKVKDGDIPVPKSGINCGDLTKFSTESDEGERPAKLLIKTLKSKKPTTSTKTCLFIHGAGNEDPADGFKTSDTFVNYWGHIEKYTPSCREHKFIRFDTVSEGWDNPSLQEDFCKFATEGNSNKEIVHKTIFSHSLGNLIIGAALHRGLCKLDHKTTKWFSAQGPWRATLVADTLGKICECLLGTKCHLKITKSWMDILSHQKYCKGPKMAQAYKGLITHYQSSSGVTFKDLVNTASSNVSGSMCGNSAWGMGKDFLDSTLLYIIQKISHLPYPNDGLVPFESCRLPGDYKQTYKNRFYNAKINHREGTCRDGDKRAANKKPCGWYGQMAELASK